MKKLSSSLDHARKEAYISRKEYNCMLKANKNLGKELRCLEAKYDNAARANDKLKVEVLLLKVNYLSMAEKNAKLEEQIVGISSSFQLLKAACHCQRLRVQNIRCCCWNQLITASKSLPKLALTSKKPVLAMSQVMLSSAQARPVPAKAASARRGGHRRSAACAPAGRRRRQSGSLK